MDIISVYEDLIFEINKAGGYLSASQFNGLSRRAELKLLDYITGKITGEIPQMYTTQKVRDWVANLVTPVALQVEMGQITKPADYYGWENAFLLGDYYKTPECDTDDEDDDSDSGTVVSDCNVPIELLPNAAFYQRCQSDIEGLAPSFKKPICKMVGKKVEFAPKDLGSIKIEYIRYPVFGELKMKFDPIYNEEVPDPATSVDYEWPDFAREFILWVLIDLFSNSTREQALKTFNQASKP